MLSLARRRRVGAPLSSIRHSSDSLVMATQIRLTQHAAIEVLEAVERLRNRIAHPVGREELRVALDFYPWLMRVGSLPFGVLRSSTKGEEHYEALSAAAALLESAVPVARSVAGLLGRQAARLTERLIAWAQRAQQVLAADVDVSVREVGPVSLDGDTTTTQLEVSVRGQGALRPLKVSCEGAWQIGLAGESQARLPFAPNELTLDGVSASAPARVWVEGRREDATLLRLNWEGTRLDGSPARGALSCELTLTPPSVHPPPVATVEPADFGASPYVTGDVVDDPSIPLADASPRTTSARASAVEKVILSRATDARVRRPSFGNCSAPEYKAARGPGARRVQPGHARRRVKAPTKELFD